MFEHIEKNMYISSLSSDVQKRSAPSRGCTSAFKKTNPWIYGCWYINIIGYDIYISYVYTVYAYKVLCMQRKNVHKNWRLGRVISDTDLGISLRSYGPLAACFLWAKVLSPSQRLPLQPLICSATDRRSATQTAGKVVLTNSTLEMFKILVRWNIRYIQKAPLNYPILEELALSPNHIFLYLCSSMFNLQGVSRHEGDLHSYQTATMVSPWKKYNPNTSHLVILCCQSYFFPNMFQSKPKMPNIFPSSHPPKKNSRPPPKKKTRKKHP